MFTAKTIMKSAAVLAAAGFIGAAGAAQSQLDILGGDLAYDGTGDQFYIDTDGSGTKNGAEVYVTDSDDLDTYVGQGKFISLEAYDTATGVAAVPGASAFTLNRASILMVTTTTNTINGLTFQVTGGSFAALADGGTGLAEYRLGFVNADGTVTEVTEQSGTAGTVTGVIDGQGNLTFGGNTLGGDFYAGGAKVFLGAKLIVFIVENEAVNNAAVNDTDIETSTDAGANVDNTTELCAINFSVDAALVEGEGFSIVATTTGSSDTTPSPAVEIATLKQQYVAEVTTDMNALIETADRLDFSGNAALGGVAATGVTDTLQVTIYDLNVSTTTAGGATNTAVGDFIVDMSAAAGDFEIKVVPSDVTAIDDTATDAANATGAWDATEGAFYGTLGQAIQANGQSVTDVVIEVDNATVIVERTFAVTVYGLDATGTLSDLGTNGATAMETDLTYLDAGAAGEWRLDTIDWTCPFLFQVNDGAYQTTCNVANTSTQDATVTADVTMGGTTTTVALGSLAAGNVAYYTAATILATVPGYDAAGTNLFSAVIRLTTDAATVTVTELTPAGDGSQNRTAGTSFHGTDATSVAGASF